jgi:hypothetical protein
MQMGLSKILTWREPDSFSLSDQPHRALVSALPALRAHRACFGPLSSLVTLSFLLQLLGLGPRRHAQ